ncbi:MAG TPA: hypothetical protein VGW36_03675 [Pyrinomonadaceae bacterium]|nr:hypothetical protein [Pyrinomonadaceae bacterium]
MKPNWEVANSHSTDEQLRWSDLSYDVRDALSGRLSGLWGATTDVEAFDSLTVDKQQALLILLSRLRQTGLWDVIRKIDNVYGEGGVGLGFSAWPFIRSTLERRRDFTKRFANHKDTTGGFYERGRSGAVLHFLYVEGTPQKWYVHFDLYSPVHSPRSVYLHFRHEFIGKLTPDWRMIREHFKD